MKKIKKSTHKHIHSHSTKKHTKQWLLRYRWILIGTLSLVVLFVGGLLYLHQQTNVLGMSTIAMLDSGGDVGGGGGTAPTSKPSCQRTYCSNYKLCTVSSSCSITCKYVPGKCGVPETCTKYITYTGCGQSSSNIKSICPQYNSSYLATAKRAVEHGCSSVCVGGSITPGRCGVASDSGASFSSVSLTVTSFTCTVKGKQYALIVKGSLKPYNATQQTLKDTMNLLPLNIELDKEIPQDPTHEQISFVSLPAKQYSANFTKSIYIDKSHILTTKIISTHIFYNRGVYTEDSSKKYLDLTKCH